MVVRAVIAVVIGVVMATAVPAPASAKVPKPPKPCKVLLPADLETIFEQPWSKGKQQLGGPCVLGRPAGAEVPNIVVSLIIEQKASTRQAKKAFARGKVATEDIVQQVEPVRALGDEGYITTIIGADVLSFRLGRDLVELRADRVDDPEATYRDQVLAAGAIVEARLLPPPKPKRRGG